MDKLHFYKAKVLEIYDADSVTISIDLGFNIQLTEKARLYGIDTPELKTKNIDEKIHGYLARNYLRYLIQDADVLIQTEKEGKFGRYLVKIYKDDIYINDLLITMGYAKPYFGEKKEKWDF